MTVASILVSRVLGCHSSTAQTRFLLFCLAICVCLQPACNRTKPSKEAVATLAYWDGMKDAMVPIQEGMLKEPKNPEELLIWYDNFQKETEHASNAITVLEVTDVDPEIIALGSRLIEWLDKYRLITRDFKMHCEKVLKFNADADSFWVSVNESLYAFKEGFVFGLSFGDSGRPPQSPMESLQEELQSERKALFQRLHDMETTTIELRRDANELRGVVASRYKLEFPPMYGGTQANEK